MNRQWETGSTACDDDYCDDVRVQVAQSDSSASATARAASGEGCVSLVATMKKKQKVTRNASRKEKITRH